MHYAAFAAAVALFLLRIPAHSQQPFPEIVVASASEDADGHTEAEMTQPFLQVIEKHAVDGITRKSKAALAAQGITAQFPPLIPSSTYTSIGGKKLAIVKLRNDYANQVLVHGFVGNEFRRVICFRTHDFKIDVPVFYGVCGDAVRTTFELKGLPELPKVK